MTLTTVHVVSKLDNAQHATFPLAQTLPPLPASSVYVRTRLVALTSNNLSYARGGGPPLHWWDAYPVPASGDPAPYHDDREAWGVVPAWGYAEVTHSTVGAIAPGALLWGFWPASGHVVPLQLEAKERPGHWKETSEHRGTLMTVYNHYEQTGGAQGAEDMHVRALCYPLWAGPNLLNRSTFSDRRIHPLGLGQPWSAEDADLSSAVVVSLGASSKTGRGLVWELARNRDTAAQGPLALLQLTSAPGTLPSFDTSLPIKSASYTEIDTAVAGWVAAHTPSRVVIIDFGASDAVLQSLLAGVVATPVTVVAVGHENKVYSSAELQARKEAGAAKVQLNTSGLRDRTIAATGAERYYREADETWTRCVADGTFGNITVKVLRGGVAGRQGIEGAWSDLCSRKVPPSVGLVIDLSE